jgi:hypothetical protein
MRLCAAIACSHCNSFNIDDPPRLRAAVEGLSGQSQKSMRLQIVVLVNLPPPLRSYG